jgi:ferritin-like metal-binding protein YciE
MTETTKRDLKLVEYLNDAYATERRLEVALQAHIAMTSRREYKARLREHLKETKAHARGVARRIKQLGGDPAAVSVPGPEPLAKGVRAAQTVAQQAVAAAQGPLHAVRGTRENERMLKNARTEFQDEAEEIANYRTIEALAKAVGDRETAKLAREIQREEKRMADFLTGMMDELAIDVVLDEVPESEIKGSARRAASSSNGATRTASRSRSAAAKSGGGRSRTAAKSGSSRSRTAAKSGSSRSRTAAKSGATKRSKTAGRAKRG